MKKIFFFMIFASLFLSVSSFASTQGYEALKGVKSAKAVFDVRIGNPQSAALHLQLIHQTYKDLTAAKKKPVFRIVFIGPSVKLISNNREGFTPEDSKALDGSVDAGSAMSKDGIQLEICLVAAQGFKVDPVSVLPAIRHVENGWVSLVGSPAKGYSLASAYLVL